MTSLLLQPGCKVPSHGVRGAAAQRLPGGPLIEGFHQPLNQQSSLGAFVVFFPPVNDKRRQGFTMSGAKWPLLSPGLTRPSRLEPVRCRYSSLSIHHQFLETPESQFAGIRSSYTIM